MLLEGHKGIVFWRISGVESVKLEKLLITSSFYVFMDR
jgi:hypothetical protein